MAYSPTKKIIGLIKISRPIHWVKNLGIFAAIIFSGDLFEKALLLKVAYGFWVFNFASSATYAFNDLIDAPRDRLHPIKKNRPLAKGDLSTLEVAILAFVLAAILLALTALGLLLVEI